MIINKLNKDYLEDIFKLGYHLIYLNDYSCNDENDDIRDCMEGDLDDEYLSKVDGYDADLTFQKKFQGKYIDILFVTCEIRSMSQAKVSIEAVNVNCDGTIDREVVFTDFIKPTVEAYKDFAQTKLIRLLNKEEYKYFNTMN